MLIAVGVVGTAIAGLILYNERKNRPQNRIADAADDAYKTMNKAIGSVERPMYHAMG